MVSPCSGGCLTASTYACLLTLGKIFAGDQKRIRKMQQAIDVHVLLGDNIRGGTALIREEIPSGHELFKGQSR